MVRIIENQGRGYAMNGVILLIVLFSTQRTYISEIMLALLTESVKITQGLFPCKQYHLAVSTLNQFIRNIKDYNQYLSLK